MPEAQTNFVIQCGKINLTTTLLQHHDLQLQVHMARFHPVAENLVLVADHTHVRLFDISTQKQLHSEERSSSTVSWSYHGSLACSANKDGKVSIESV